MTEVPLNWASATGKDLFSLVRGVSYDKSDASDQPGDDFVPILRANNISAGRIVTDDLVYVPRRYVSAHQFLRAGDLLIAASSGSRTVVGKAARADEAHQQFAFGAFCAVARSRTNEISSWLSCYIKTRAYREYVERVALGININNLRSSDLLAMTVQIAPVPEQGRIVAKIDSLSAKSKRGRDHLDHIPRLVEKYKQAILAAAFQGDLTRNWRSENFVEKDAHQFIRERVRASDELRNSDIVTDYSSAQGNVLHFTGIDADETLADDQNFTFRGTEAFTAAGQINWFTNGTDTFLQFNTNADLNAEGVIQLNGVINGDAVLMFL